jgi:hypothetical protein
VHASENLYCAQYSFFRNIRKDDRTRRAATIATLTNMEEEP